MTQPPQYGPPQTPPPGWGPPPGQPYPGGPGGPYGPPPPKKGLGAGAVIAIIFGVIIAGLILLFVLVALLTTGDSTSTDKPKAGQQTSAPAKSAPAPAPSTKAPAKQEEPAADAPVKVTATTVAFKPSVLHDGTTAYTSVKVTVRNDSDEKISINPLYFSITDTAGSKHTAELGVDKDQIDTVDLAPGENITGVITGEGKFTAAYVTYVNGLFGDGVRGNVK
ncbi:DUF4352 domain-containing protein [Streptomyces exfoliatus]|uniref:DUF4352 domain-containing protein n=1 Tax=Streptomyces exfoliatus TaxID=1905 RepID=UPI003C2E637B